MRLTETQITALKASALLLELWGTHVTKGEALAEALRDIIRADAKERPKYVTGRAENDKP